MIKKQEYLLNPKKCNFCRRDIPFGKRRNRYCSQSCSATSTNLNRGKTTHRCLCCEKQINGKGKKFCSHSCQWKYELEKNIETFLTGENLNFHPRTIKRIAVSHYGHKCMSCNNTEWLGKPISLEMHHIDGDANNDTKENILLLCPNCHSQTENYGRKNKKSSRTNRKKYYQNKS